MSSTILYCESCRERIASADLEAGRAMWFRDACYCPKCRHELSAMLGQPPAQVPPPRKGAASPAKSAAAATKPATPARPRSGGAPSWTAPAITVAVLVLALVGFALTRDDGRPAAPTAVPPTAPKATPPTAAPPAVTNPEAAALAVLEAAMARTPMDFAVHLERLAELRKTFASAPHLAALDEIERSLEAGRERAAQERFDQLLREAHALVSQDQFDPAIDRWGEFGEQLLTPAWRERVDREVADLTARRDARDAAQPKPVPTSVPPTPAPIPPRPPDPDPARVRTLFDGKTSAGWTLGDAARWRVADGSLVGVAGPDATFARIADDPGAAYVLRFELRRSVGHVYLRYHWTEPGEVYGLNLPSTGSGAQADEWVACVAVIRDVETTTYFLTSGVVRGAPFHQRFVAGTGRVGFILGPGASVELRAISLERR